VTGRRGTTVLELVVALVITAAVAAAGASAFRQVVDRRVTVVAATRSTERAAALRATLREWIGTASLDPETPARGLCAAVRSPASEAAITQELDGTITALQVEYLDRATGQWMREPALLAGRPRAVRLALPGDEAQAPLWQLPLTLVVDSLPLSWGAS
jgi:type II secretory pathway pseudopilin PulG